MARDEGRERRRAQRWPPDEALREMYRLRYTPRQIADYVLENHGWRPSPSALSHKRQRLEIPPVRTRRTLVPSHVSEEHSRSRWRHMLSAEDKRRKKEPLSKSEQRLVTRLRALLHAHLTPDNELAKSEFVIVYMRDTGWFLVDREPFDDDIVRHVTPETPPSASDCAADGLPGAFLSQQGALVAAASQAGAS